MPLASNAQLVEKIQQVIGQAPNQVLPFVTFMEMALYEPELGYYASSHRQLGPQGDFVTSPHLCSDFGELIALQLKEFWQVLGSPHHFTVVEMGAGQGLISVDALSFLIRNDPCDPFLQALEWKMVETSQALIRWQKHYLAQRIKPLLSSFDLDLDIQWSTLEQLKASPITGCFFSNELVDAFPIHLLEVQNSTFVELGVTCCPDRDVVFQWSPLPLSSEVKRYCSDLQISADGLPEGYRCEVNVATQSWVKAIANSLKEGFLLTIDYGYSQQQLYNPARQGGTLQCYTQQKSHGDPFFNVGNQDITSHVNFTALEYFGAQNNLDKLTMTHQGLFLMALGLGDRLLDNNTQTDMALINETLQRREALHALMNPMGLGGFKVLLQGKGLDEFQKKYAFRGFTDPLPDSLI